MLPNHNYQTQGPGRAALDRRNFAAGRTDPGVGGRLSHSAAIDSAPFKQAFREIADAAAKADGKLGAVTESIGHSWDGLRKKSHVTFKDIRATVDSNAAGIARWTFTVWRASRP